MGKFTAYRIISKHLSDFKEVDADKFIFSSDLFKSVCMFDDRGMLSKTIHDIKIERILNKIRFHNCYPAHVRDNIFKLETFTLKESDDVHEYLYHSTDISPDLILREGIKIRYSFNCMKGFNPLVFLSTTGFWCGKYVYRVRNRQKLFYDTNLNWKRRNGGKYFCALQNIKPCDITLHAIR